jgi:hypothetical protein
MLTNNMYENFSLSFVIYFTVIQKRKKHAGMRELSKDSYLRILFSFAFFTNKI